MSYTQELLLRADEVIPRVTLADFQNDLNANALISSDNNNHHDNNMLGS